MDHRRQMEPLRAAGFLLLLTMTAHGIHIPLEVEQMPTITNQSPSKLIAFPYDENVTLTCEAIGNPKPVFRWTKDGLDFDPRKDPKLSRKENSGNFAIPNNSHITKYQGTYRCYVSNKLGTVISTETELIVPSVPKFAKVKSPPIEVEEGQGVMLECSPPTGIPPVQLYWMTNNLLHIVQDERVYMGSDGNLYFSNTLQKDSHKDYCCVAAFPSIRTIVQKVPMALIVKPLEVAEESKPQLMVPPGEESQVLRLKGEDLNLECIPQGLPTPSVQWTKVGEELSQRTNIKNYGKLLTISKVEEEDSGSYMCKAKNSVGETEHVFHVTVEEPPRWIEQPQSQVAVIGSDVHIKCSATGSPRPKISWRRNGEALEAMAASHGEVFDDTIVLYRVQEKDSASYQCEASNRHSSILASANILVLNLPPLVLTKDHQEYAAVRGGSGHLDCEIFSSPPATINWSKVGLQGPLPSERFMVLDNGSLQLLRVEKEDSGSYACVGANSEGNSSISAELFVKDPTVIVEPPQDSWVRRGTATQLQCQAECDTSLQGELEIVWEKNGIELTSNFTEGSGYLIEGGLLKFMNVNHGDKGEYKCIARTSLDQAKASARLTVLDVPDAPEDLALSDLQNRSVKLEWVPKRDHSSNTTEYIIEYEEDHWEPGRWRELQRVRGNQTSALLKLHGHLNYQFRVSAVNAVGRGSPSRPSKRYKTPPTAPDRNPESIKIEGHLPHQMDITWEPLLPVEHNAPGLEYKVSYRRLAVEDSWKEQMVKRHAFVVKNTPTFVPYEIKIQSHNQQGWGPEPAVLTGYSGEDLPLAAPKDVAVEVINSTLVRVSWSPVPMETLRGHLGGHTVHWWRTRSLLTSRKIAEEKQSLMLPGNRSHVLVPGLVPYSEYSVTMGVFNKRGQGPNCPPLSFTTPEGAPDRVPMLTATNAQGSSITLVWAPPAEANGILTGYELTYHMINESMATDDPVTVNLPGPDTTKWVLHGLDKDRTYKFYLRACTEAGCGPAISDEAPIDGKHLSSTTLVMSTEIYEMRQPFSFTSANTAIPTVNATLLSIALFNISSMVSDTYARISWTSREELLDSELRIAVMNHRDGNWIVSDAVNSSKSFHIVEGLEPETVYTVRVLVDPTITNSSLYEEVFQTKAKGVEGLQGEVSPSGWFIGMMCTVAALTLIVLIACFVRRNKGGKYSVKEKEDVHPDLEAHGLSEETSCEYSDSDEKPLKSSARGVSSTRPEGDSLDDCGDVESQFDEDGSFIGEYAGHKRRSSLGENGGFSAVV